MASCRDVVGYECFGGPCCLHLHGEGFMLRSPCRRRKSLLHPLEKRLGGFQNWSGCGDENKTLLSLPLAEKVPSSSSP